MQSQIFLNITQFTVCLENTKDDEYEYLQRPLNYYSHYSEGLFTLGINQKKLLHMCRHIPPVVYTGSSTCAGIYRLLSIQAAAHVQAYTACCLHRQQHMCRHIPPVVYTGSSTCAGIYCLLSIQAAAHVQAYIACCLYRQQLPTLSS